MVKICAPVRKVLRYVYMHVLHYHRRIVNYRRLYMNLVRALNFYSLIAHVDFIIGSGISKSAQSVVTCTSYFTFNLFQICPKRDIGQ